MSTVVILGASGLLGRELRRRFSENYTCFCPTHAECDVTNFKEVKSLIDTIKPDIVINAAAYTDVDGCEQNRCHAWLLNTMAPENIALACMEAGVYLIHMSSDYVFNGRKKSPYQINDETFPLSFYGETKLQAEQRIERVCCTGLRAIIVRTSWVFGRYRSSFPEAMLTRAMSSKGPVRVVDDQVGSPTLAWDLARSLEQVADRRWTGVIHLANKGGCSRYEMTKLLFKEARKLTGLGIFDEARIEPAKTADFPAPAVRPAYSVLDIHVAETFLVKTMLDWQEAVQFHVHQLSKNGFFPIDETIQPN